MKIRLAALFLTLSAFPAAATVEPGKEGILAEFVKPVPGERICFARRYDAAHLAKHPKQTVTAIEFRLSYFKHEPDADNKAGQRNYYYHLAVRFRDRPDKAFTAGGDCYPGKGSISCTVECDGGGVRVRWQKRPESILIDYGGGYGIRLSACGGDEDLIDKNMTEEERARAEEEYERNRAVLQPGQDDKLFLLTRVKDSECPDYEKW